VHFFFSFWSFGAYGLPSFKKVDPMTWKIFFERSILPFAVDGVETFTFESKTS